MCERVSQTWFDDTGGRGGGREKATIDYMGGGEV